MKIVLDITEGCQYHDKQFHDKENSTPFKIITIKLTPVMMQDCYSYAPLDAPSELKSLLMEAVGMKLDEIILNECPKHVDEKYLKKKLDSIEVRYKDV